MADESASDCPATGRLADLLVDHVSSPERARIEDHLEACEGCRQTLERLAADPAEWETWGRRLKAERVAWPAAPEHREGPVPTPQVPGYEILGVLGRGGMGVVFKARQVALDRLVALKVIRSARYGDPDYCQRFRQEARIVARLHHPNIVQVYDSGEADGWTFLTLELVEGGTLAKALSEHPLPAREAARLVETLARAVHTAHQAGIIHRDLKPANILLASGGREPPVRGAETGGSRPPLANVTPKIADFGLARHGERPGVTRSGDVMGTPEYMAPEQARATPGWSAPPVDIYGLGAVLYESLTGRPPFRAETALATMRLVSDTEPVSPAQLQPGLPPDLETICLACLRKSPRERYKSALDLAEDLRRFLAGEPIAARPVSAWARAAKWAARHPVAAGLGVLSASLLLGLLAVWAHFTAGLRDTNVELDRLNTALSAESALLEQKHLETVRQQRTIDANLADAVRGVRTYAQMLLTDRQLRATGGDPHRINLLARTLATYSDLVKLLDGRDELRLERARAFHAMSRLSRELGQPDQAEAYCRQAIAAWDALPPGTLVEIEHALEPGICRVNLANLAFSRRRYAETEEWFRQAIAVYLALAPTSPGEVAQRQYHLAVARNQLGYLLMHPQNRRLPEAARELEAADRAIRDSLKVNDPPLTRALVAKVDTNLGLLHEHRGQWAEAKSAYERAVPRLEALVGCDPDHTDHLTDLAVAYKQLGLWHRQHAAVEDALTVLRKADQLRARLVAGHPRSHRHRYELGMNFALIGELHAKAGRKEEAAEAFRDAVPHLVQAVKRSAPEWDYSRHLAEVVLHSARLDAKLGHPVASDRVEAALASMRPFAERPTTRAAAGKVLEELERLRRQPAKGTK